MFWQIWKQITSQQDLLQQSVELNIHEHVGPFYAYEEMFGHCNKSTQIPETVKSSRTYCERDDTPSPQRCRFQGVFDQKEHAGQYAQRGVDCSRRTWPKEHQGALLPPWGDFGFNRVKRMFWNGSRIDEQGSATFDVFGIDLEIHD